MPTVYFEDLEIGSLHLGRECVCDKDEMLEFSRRNDPWPFHVDEAAATLSPYGGIVASGGFNIFFCERPSPRVQHNPPNAPGVLGRPGWAVYDPRPRWGGSPPAPGGAPPKRT